MNGNDAIADLQDDAIADLQDVGAAIGTTPPKTACRLEPATQTHSIAEGLQARVKDPLWLLGRQWQMGEFRARNGGQLVRAELEIRYRPLTHIDWPSRENQPPASEPIDLNAPLEMKVEEEEAALGLPRAKAWDPMRLAYSFGLKGEDTELVADEYNGDELDWYSFSLRSAGAITDSAESLALKPVPVSFRGMPAARWWSIEDGRIDLGQINRPQLNFLAMLLLEFSFVFSPDWYVVPVAHPVGHIRQLERARVIDSFGVVADVNPVVDITPDRQGWEVFTLDRHTSTELSDGRLFYLPNSLYHALEGEAVEQVSFLRDEMANLVWAVEHRYQDDDGLVVNRSDETLHDPTTEPTPSRYWDTRKGTLVERSQISGDDEPGRRYLGPVELYLPKTYVPDYWIPYTPRQLDTTGRFVLRRARTLEDLSRGPQYKGLVVGESKYLREEHIPRLGVLVSRAYQIARGSDGRRYLWCGRKKRPDVIRRASGLRFDALIGV